MTIPKNKKLLSIIIPLHNEERNVVPFLNEFQKIEDKLAAYDLELIFVNDGSTDNSREIITEAQARDKRIRYIEFSRNFGKEAATSAGLHNARGDAALLIDADLQHPIAMIPEFVAKWEEGSEVVVGVRKQSKSEGVVRRLGSYFYYKVINLIADAHIIPQATDFRLIDRIVIDQFKHLAEHSRITRGLIDWLGFRRAIVYFEANERKHGVPTYRISSLCHLAIVSFVSSSTFPLRLAGYLGFIITVLSGLLGVIELCDRFVFGWGLNFTGTAMLATTILFLVGIILMSLGILAFYMEHIFHNTQSRPIYVIREIREQGE